MPGHILSRAEYLNCILSSWWKFENWLKCHGEENTNGKIFEMMHLQ